MTTDILCRFDAAKREGVVFLADTMKGNKIQAWNGTGNPVYVPLDYYHQTGPLSASDEKVLMERFKQATNRQDTVVRLRQRLPRTSRPLPNLLSAGKEPESVLQPAPTVLPQVAAVVPVAGELRSALLYRQILADNERLVQMQSVIGNLNQQVADITAQIAQFAAEFEAAKASYSKLTVDYEKSIEEEAKALLEQRKAELAAVGQTPAHAVPPVPAPAVSVPVAAPKAPARKAPAAKRTSRKPAAKKATSKRK